MTIMSHQPARAGSPARLGQLTHPLTSSWDLWSPRLTRILQDFAFFLSCQGCSEAIEKATKIRHGLLRNLSFVFLFVLLSDVSRKIWAPVHSSTWLDLLSSKFPLVDHHSTHPPYYRVVFLTGPPLKMSLDWPPPKMPRLAPPTLKKYGD